MSMGYDGHVHGFSLFFFLIYIYIIFRDVANDGVGLGYQS